MKTGALFELSEASSGASAFCFEDFICLESDIVRVASAGRFMRIIESWHLQMLDALQMPQARDW